MVFITHVMAPSSICFHTCFSRLSPVSIICKRKTLYSECNIVQTLFLSSSITPPDSVSNFIEHVSPPPPWSSLSEQKFQTGESRISHIRVSASGCVIPQILHIFNFSLHWHWRKLGAMVAHNCGILLLSLGFLWEMGGGFRKTQT